MARKKAKESKGKTAKKAEKAVEKDVEKDVDEEGGEADDTDAPVIDPDLVQSIAKVKGTIRPFESLS
jgi:hypothetical protein